MLIGLTGAYCAGKNHVGKLIEKRGFTVLDVDKLGHVAIRESKDLLVRRFGKDILQLDGEVDRKALGALVFSKPKKLRNLEEIVHPIVNRMTEEWVMKNVGSNLAINAALLHRSSVIDRLDFILLVRAPLLVRLLRAKKRDKLPIIHILKRFASQKNFASQYLEKETDIYTVDNRASFGIFAKHAEQALEQSVDAILAREGMVQ